MSEIKDLLQKLTKQDVLVAKLCRVVEGTINIINNTCTVEPIIGEGHDSEQFNEDRFIYNVNFSKAGVPKATVLEDDNGVMKILTNNIVLVLFIDDKIPYIIYSENITGSTMTGTKSKILLDKPTNYTGKRDDKNTEAIYLETESVFSVDLTGDGPYLTMNNAKFLINNAPRLHLENKCGSYIDISKDCIITINGEKDINITSKGKIKINKYDAKVLKTELYDIPKFDSTYINYFGRYINLCINNSKQEINDDSKMTELKLHVNKFYNLFFNSTFNNQELIDGFNEYAAMKQQAFTSTGKNYLNATYRQELIDFQIIIMFLYKLPQISSTNIIACIKNMEGTSWMYLFKHFYPFITSQLFKIANNKLIINAAIFTSITSEINKIDASLNEYRTWKVVATNKDDITFEQENTKIKNKASFDSTELTLGKLLLSTTDKIKNTVDAVDDILGYLKTDMSNLQTLLQGLGVTYSSQLVLNYTALTNTLQTINDNLSNSLNDNINKLLY